MEKTIKLKPKKGKVLLDKRTRTTYTEVICTEADKNFFIEIKVE